MARVVLLVLLAVCIRAQNLHITNSIPFGTSSLKVVFSQDISSLELKPIKLSENLSYIDITAILDNGKKIYYFPRNAQVTIGQNTPQVARIVIDSSNGMICQVKAIQKDLYLSFVDKIPDSAQSSNVIIIKSSTQSPTQPKSAQTSSAKSTPTTTQAQNPSAPKPQPQKQSKGFKIVIDAGHGGKDCGAMGINKVCEKHIVLKVAQTLNQELKSRGYTTFMTRDKDVYLNLKERTDLANAKNADLFVSIHANSVPEGAKKTSKGVETYFLSAARSDRARDVAEQENKDDIDIMNYFSKQTFLNSLNSHRLLASNKLAIDIQYGILKELRKNYQGVVDGGVREGPFWVLAGALMPSVLVEIGYNSNPIESKRLNDPKYQKALAIGIADGVDGFFIKNY